jgi:glycosyltransferase involved in cell wall biosynthesis
MEIRKIDQKRPKIALLIARWTPILGGRQLLVLKLAEALAANGYDVEILSSGKAPKLPPHAEFKSFPRFAYTAFCFGYLLLNKKKYRLTHAHSRMATLAMKLASIFTHTPSVVTVHSTHLFTRGFSFKKWLDQVIYLKAHYTQEVSATHHFLKAKNKNKPVLVIPHGIDLQVFDDCEVERDPRLFHALFVGELSKSKGADVLLKAVQKLIQSDDFLQSHKEFHCHIVGDGPERKVLKAWSKANGMEKWIHFHGYRRGEKLIELYKSCHLFVLPSRLEGMPLTLLEACAARLPILATQTGDNAEFVVENSNGHLIPPGNVDELAYYLERFALNPSLEKMGEASYALVQEHYDWASILDKYLRVYAQLPSSHSGNSRLPVWKSPSILLKEKAYERAQLPTTALNFCFTVNVEQPNASEELPHEVAHIQPFLERLSDFTGGLGIPSTLLIQSDLLPPFAEEFRAMQDLGHELGFKLSQPQWNNPPDRKKVLRQLRELAEIHEIPRCHFVRISADLSEEDYDLLQEHGFDSLPVSEDPLPRLEWRFGVPHGHPTPMNLLNFLTLSEDKLLKCVNRLRIEQKARKMPSFLIFECNSWEFQSRDDIPYASGQNFTELAKRLAFLREHMDLNFMSLSEFCESCKVQKP